MIPRRVLPLRSLAHAVAALLLFVSAGAPDVRADLPDAVEARETFGRGGRHLPEDAQPALCLSGHGVRGGRRHADRDQRARRARSAADRERRNDDGSGARCRGAKAPQSREAKVVALDKVHDLALLRISGAPLPTVTLRQFGHGARRAEHRASPASRSAMRSGFHPVTHRGIIARADADRDSRGDGEQLDARASSEPEGRSVRAVPARRHRVPGPQRQPALRRRDRRGHRHRQHGHAQGDEGPGGRPASGISFAVPARYLQELLRAPR